MNTASAWAGLALIWLAALAGLHQCAQLPLPAWALGATLLGALGVLLTRWRLPRLVWPAMALLTAGLALAWGGWRAQLRLDQALSPAWEGRDLIVEGRIDSLPSASSGMAAQAGWRFAFAVEGARDAQGQGAPIALPERLLLVGYGDASRPLPDWRACERWRLRVRLRQPHGLVNPHGFDYELWLFEQGFRATGVIRDAGQRLAPSPWLCLDHWREGLRETIQRSVSDPRQAALIAALSLGEQAAISREDWALFRDTGIAHLVSISGMHVTMFAWLLGGLAGRLWRRSTVACLWLPAPLAAQWLGAAAAALYAAFSGWGVPSQRTVWMLLTLALLRHIGVRWPWPLCLLASAVLVTAIDPWALSQPGFWLSFVAVALLMAQGEPAPAGWRAALKSAWQAQWVATLGLAPLSLLFFQQLSIVGLLANLLAIPLVSFVITPLALLGALVPLLWVAAGWAIALLMAWLQWLASWPLAVWVVPVAPLWAQVSGLLAAVLLVLPLPGRLRALSLPMLLPLLWPPLQRPPPGEFELLAADIGQGSAVLLRTATHSLMYDSGPQWSPTADAGQRVLLPLLHALGERRLDLLMLSHRDLDHVGGAASLLRGLPVAALSSSLEAGHVLLRQLPAASSATRCLAGQHWVWDGVLFELLQPQASQYEQGLKPNALSCVLRVQAVSGHSALLTGDLEVAQEQALLQRDPARLRSELLLVPHHGSQTSSSQAFIAAVAPRWGLVQAGYRNRFGHPALSVQAGYQAAGVPLLLSADCGAWRWQSWGLEPQCQRELDRRYWQPVPSTRAQTGAERPADLGPELVPTP
ncbi:DNA internalization-related competence protein ComEC/Rec2 [Paucibacter sp. APW11]|uniref:DNA internalization-related competence protein ComEC/Rec2 n=1 Tax=Roseateles aquae TaxID=3077235 RepID=A0ABU3P954_9BURK|nr:DNA internalization-related competence protein ComEC/Rec2 [Paucibacter sp. APW11]MDT8999102.1 DNA internalization-related competence protein ComEC/Rec2 [Paucibacter sp. APW11]